MRSTTVVLIKPTERFVMENLSAQRTVEHLYCTGSRWASLPAALASFVSPAPSIAPPGQETASQLPELGYTIFSVYALRAAATFTLVASRFAQSMNVFPCWLTIVGFLVGIVLLLSVTFSHLLVFIFPMWTLL